MIVIESGGTKSTWVFKDENNQVKTEVLDGLHPQELSDDKIKNVAQFIKDFHLFGQEVHFYGAGCESPEAKHKITSFFQDLNLAIVQIQTDIYAACLASYGNRRGIVGILGTGAVAALYDGEKIVQQTSGLGYILGDEGSGFDIGKRLLKLYFDKELSQPIVKTIDVYFNGKSILHRIYEADGRKKVAGLTKVIFPFKQEVEVHKVIYSAFDEFCTQALKPFSKEEPVSFIGSVAYHFEETLKEVVEAAGYQFQTVHKEAAIGVFNHLSQQSFLSSLK